MPKTRSTKRAKSYIKKNERNNQDSNNNITSTNSIETTNDSNNASNIDSNKKKKTAGTVKEENASSNPRPDGNFDRKSSAMSVTGSLMNKLTTTSKIIRNKKPLKSSTTRDDEHKSSSIISFNTHIIQLPKNKVSSSNDIHTGNVSETNNDQTTNQNNMASMNEKTVHGKSKRKPNRVSSINIAMEKEEEILTTNIKPGIIVTLNTNRFHQAHPISNSNPKGDHDKRKQATTLGGIIVSKVKTSNVDADKITKNTVTTKEENTSSESYRHQDSYEKSSITDNQPVSQDSSVDDSSLNKSSKASEIPEKNKSSKNKVSPSYDTRTSNASDSNNNQTTNRDDMINTVKENEENNLATHTKPGIIVTLNTNRYHHVRPMSSSNSKVDNDKRKQAPSFGGITVTKLKTTNVSDETNDVDSANITKNAISPEAQHQPDFDGKSSAMDNRSASQHSSRNRSSRTSEIIARNTPVEPSTAREEEHESSSPIPRNRETSSYSRQPSNVSESNNNQTANRDSPISTVKENEENNLATHTKLGIIVTLNANRYHHARPVSGSNSKFNNDKSKQAPSFGGITVTKVKTNNVSDQINDVDSAMDNRSASQHSSRNRSSRASEIIARNTPVEPSTAREEEHESSSPIPRNRETSSYSRQPSNVSESNNNQTTNRDSPIDVVKENEENNLATHKKSGIVVTLNPNRYHQAHPVSHANSKNDNATRKRASSFGSVTVSKIKSTHDNEQSGTNVVAPNDDQNDINNLVTEVSV